MTKKREGSARSALEQALSELGLADPRPALRDRLRSLRESNPDAFEQATARFETMVAGADADVLASWIEYGRYLGDVTGEGRLLRIDDNGFATPYAAPPGHGALLLHLPEDVSVPALPVMLPASPSPAQQATLDLLVGRKLAL